MNSMREQIQAAMRVEDSSVSDKVRGRFVFETDFVGFQGHFPDRPILPGVCKIQAALVLLEYFTGKRFVLRRVVSAKFFTPALPGDVLSFECVFVPAGTGYSVKVSVKRGDEKAARLNLELGA